MYTIAWLLVASLLGAVRVQANVKAVFAHFMVGNTGSYTVADWQDDMTKAQAAHIDGFVLNMARGEATNGASLGNAFTAAGNLGSTFKLLFSFDYAGNGLWDKADVIALINQYSSKPAYYKHGSKPLVTTFEGPAASADWPEIKTATNCFFMPSWSSLGAGPAWAKGTADGLSNWAAWPEGPNSMSTFTDYSYTDALGGASYMMPVAPWFYTNMPGFRKNWLWRGDSLWFDRWVHVMSLQPEYVQIISWNDYGECHHIGPLRSNAYVAFDAAHGRAPLNYALNKNHDGWRTFLPFLIDMAKSNTTSFNTENVVAWYREHPHSACGTGGTTGNTASQLQQVYPPAVLAQDKVFYAALLGSAATVSVSIGGQVIASSWTISPSGGAGLYRGSSDTGGRTGTVVVTISRSGAQILSASGDAITTACPDGIENWNANVIVGNPRSISSVSPLSLASSVCTSGFGDPKYLDLCSFACKYGYCPSVCTCTSLGAAIARPTALNVNGCPKPGIDSTYLGLCSFGCNYGNCPASLCQTYPAGHTCTAPNPVAPPIPVCVAGMADGPYADLCSFSCYYGFCPPEICTCTQAGTAGPSPPALTAMIGGPAGATTDYGLCQWACAHGNCPSNLCTCSGSGCTGGGVLPGGGSLSFEDPTNLALVNLVGGPGRAWLIGGLGKGNIGGSAGDPNGHMGGGGGADGNLGSHGPGGVQQQLGGPRCRLAIDCTAQDNTFESRCESHEVKLGWDKDECQGDYMGRSICCPASEAVTECSWRGGGSDCNGQCHEGEMQLWASRWGGGQGNSVGACFRGTKAFCCKSLEYSLITYGCHWSGCWHSCNSQTETAVLSKTVNGFCTPGMHSTDLCCPKPVALKECRWRGTWPDCADAKCNDDEVTVDRFSDGDSSTSCWWGRQRVACCKVDIPTRPLPGYCPDYDWCQAFPLECALEADDAMGFEGSAAISSLNRRGGEPRRIASRVDGLFDMTSNRYPSRGVFIQKILRTAPQVYYYLVSTVCEKADVIRKAGSSAGLIPAALDTEHPVDLQVLMRFAESCVTGNLPGGGRSVLSRISPAYFNQIFSQDFQLPPGLPPVSPTSPDITNPMSRVFEAFGSNSNLAPFLLADGQMNQIKGALIGLKQPLGYETLGKLVVEGMSGGVGSSDAAAKWMSYVKKSISVFNYFQDPTMKAALEDTVASIRTQLDIIEHNTIGASGLVHHWDEYWEHLMVEMPIFTRGVVTDYINIVINLLDQHRPADYMQKKQVVLSWLGQIGNIHF